MMENGVAGIKKLALILPPPWVPLIAPLGICTVGEVFKRQGIECSVLDWSIELWRELQQRRGASFNHESPLFWSPTYCSPSWSEAAFFDLPEGREIAAWLDQRLSDLMSAGFTAFGLSVFDMNFQVAKYVIQSIRKRQPDALILVGGPGVNQVIEYQCRDRWLSDADYYFYTEAEAAIEAFVSSFTGRAHRVRIPGTAYYSQPNEAPTYTPLDKPTSLTLIPPVNFDALNLKRYLSKAVPVEFSRGCSGACSFCSESRRYNPYRVRLIAAIIQDISRVVSKYGSRYIFLCCSALNGNRQHLSSFCDAMKAVQGGKIRVRWWGNARLDPTLDADLLARMAQAGCGRLIFGLESGSDSVLRLMNKRSDTQIAASIVNICADLGIRLAINLIVGFPGETQEDFEKTMEFIGQHHQHVETFSVGKCYVDRQAALGRHPERFGVLTGEGGEIVAVDPQWPPGSGLPPMVPNGPHWSDWTTVTGDNTPYIREQRFRRVLEYLDELRKRGITQQDPRHGSELLAPRNL